MFNSKSVPQKKYLRQLKSIVRSDTMMLKKRLSTFPLKSLHTVLKYQFQDNTTMTIQGNDYEVKDAVKKVLDIYGKLMNESKPANYNETLKEFIRAAHNKENQDLITVYNKYKDILKKRNDDNKESLYFCLEVMKSLSKIIKEQRKIKQNMEVIDNGTTVK